MLSKYLDTLQDLRDTITNLQLRIVKEQESEWKLLTEEPLDYEHKLISLKFGRRTGASSWVLAYAQRNEDVVILCSDVCRAELLYYQLDNDKIMIVPVTRQTLRKADYEFLSDKIVILDGYTHVPPFIINISCKLLIMI